MRGGKGPSVSGADWTGSLHVSWPSLLDDEHVRAAGPEADAGNTMAAADGAGLPQLSAQLRASRRSVPTSSHGSRPHVPSRPDFACGEAGTQIKQFAGSCRAAKTGPGPPTGASSCKTAFCLLVQAFVPPD